MCWPSKAPSTRLLNLTEFNRKRVQSFVLWGGNKDRIVNQSFESTRRTESKIWASNSVSLCLASSKLFVQFWQFFTFKQTAAESGTSSTRVEQKAQCHRPSLTSVHLFCFLFFLLWKYTTLTTRRLPKTRWQLPPHRLSRDHVLCLEICRCELSHPQH